MNYLLDTNIISFLYDTSREPYHSKTLQRLQLLKESDQLQTSVLTLYELGYSHENAPEMKQWKINRTISQVQLMFDIMPLKVENYVLFGKLKVLLRKQKNSTAHQMKKHNIDLMIASTAIAEGAILVSADKIYLELAQFIPELRVKDWTL